MFFKRRIRICGIGVCLLCCFAMSTLSHAGDANNQLVENVNKILAETPLKPGEKLQLIKVAEDDTVTIYVGRMIQGGQLKPHFHKSHAETVYVIRGTGQMLIDSKWVDLKPGSLHFNPIMKIHAPRQTGGEELVFISVFTPALKDPDRHFVP